MTVDCSNAPSAKTSVARICTINICGLSQRSNMMLNKYIYDKNIMVLGVQETGNLKKSRYRYLNEMNTFVDTNEQSKRCALFVRKGVMFIVYPAQ